MMNGMYDSGAFVVPPHTGAFVVPPHTGAFVVPPHTGALPPPKGLCPCGAVDGCDSAAYGGVAPA